MALDIEWPLRSLQLYVIFFHISKIQHCRPTFCSNLTFKKDALCSEIVHSLHTAWDDFVKRRSPFSRPISFSSSVDLHRSFPGVSNSIPYWPHAIHQAINSNSAEINTRQSIVADYSLRPLWTAATIASHHDRRYFRIKRRNVNIRMFWTFRNMELGKTEINNLPAVELSVQASVGGDGTVMISD